MIKPETSRIFVISLKLSTCLTLTAYPQKRGIEMGYAHNDYLHKRPLIGALEKGFTNIEVDIFLKNGELVVAHWFPYFKKGKTLKTLYLDPLRKYIQDNATDSSFKPITLLIDIKSSPVYTYKALKTILDGYKDILSEYENGKWHRRKVNIILTGRQPLELIAKETKRYVMLDDHLVNPADNFYNDIFAMASCKYSHITNWKVEGKMPEKDKMKLIGFVEAAHKQGKLARLWASPENNIVRQELLDCGLDFINTDILEDLKLFLETQDVKPSVLAYKNTY